MPGLARLYARALAGGIPLRDRRTHSTGDESRDGLTLRVEDLAVDDGHLAEYRRVCGFGPGERLPATYPQAVAFPLVLMLLTDPGFPFGAMGTLHIANAIRYARPLTSLDRLDYEVAAGPAAGHPRGRTVSVQIAASAGAEVVWRADMTLLHRERPPSGSADCAGEQPDLPADPPTGPQVWRLASDVGRRYAAVSGDRNPIHISDLTAKPFGFRRHIAHGMWTHARALAELENRLPDAYDVEVAFKKPVSLPGAVAFGARVFDDRIDFGVSSRAEGSAAGDSSAVTHLLGRVRPR
jgi:acyl dehydratase